MARMLGRYESRGCCWATRQGWRRVRRISHLLDCPGAGTSARQRKRVEGREWRREAAAELGRG